MRVSTLSLNYCTLDIYNQIYTSAPRISTNVEIAIVYLSLTSVMGKKTAKRWKMKTTVVQFICFE